MFDAFILPFLCVFLAVGRCQRAAPTSVLLFSPTGFNQFLNKFYNFV